MKCSKCPAWGIDNLGFRGCLIRNSILGDIYCNYHCNRHTTNDIIMKNGGNYYGIFNSIYYCIWYSLLS